MRSCTSVDLAVAELDVHRSLALDPGQRADVQDVAAVGELVVHGATSASGGRCSWRSLSRRNASEAALNVRKIRTTSGSLMPCRAQPGCDRGGVRRVLRPEAAVAAARESGAQRAAARLGDRARDTGSRARP